MTQQVCHLTCRNLLGIEEVVDTHIDEKLLVIGLKILVVVDAGDGLLRTELLRHHRRQDIMSLFVIYGDEEVAASYTRLAQHRKGGGVALNGD